MSTRRAARVGELEADYCKHRDRKRRAQRRRHPALTLESRKADGRQHCEAGADEHVRPRKEPEDRSKLEDDPREGGHASSRSGVPEFPVIGIQREVRPDRVGHTARAPATSTPRTSYAYAVSERRRRHRATIVARAQIADVDRLLVDRRVGDVLEKSAARSCRPRRDCRAAERRTSRAEPSSGSRR